MNMCIYVCTDLYVYIYTYIHTCVYVYRHQKIICAGLLYTTVVYQSVFRRHVVVWGWWAVGPSPSYPGASALVCSSGTSCITLISRLSFLGLCSSNPCRFKFSVFLSFCWNRTHDLVIISPALWSTELALHCLGYTCHTLQHTAICREPHNAIMMNREQTGEVTGPYWACGSWVLLLQSCYIRELQYPKQHDRRLTGPGLLLGLYAKHQYHSWYPKWDSQVFSSEDGQVFSFQCNADLVMVAGLAIRVCCRLTSKAWCAACKLGVGKAKYNSSPSHWKRHTTRTR